MVCERIVLAWRNKKNTTHIHRLTSEMFYRFSRPIQYTPVCFFKVWSQVDDVHMSGNTTNTRVQAVSIHHDTLG